MAAPLPDKLPSLESGEMHLNANIDNDLAVPDINPHKSLPDGAMAIEESQVDTIKLREVVDETLSIREAKDDIRLSIALGVTLCVLTSPLIVGAYALGGAGGLMGGVIKNLFMWDYEYGKEKKTNPYVYPLLFSTPFLFFKYTPELNIPIGTLKSIKKETFDASLSLGTWLAIHILLAPEPLAKFFEEQREKNAKNKT